MTNTTFPTLPPLPLILAGAGIPGTLFLLSFSLPRTPHWLVANGQHNAGTDESNSSLLPR